jgi:hypothetical protein
MFYAQVINMFYSQLIKMFDAQLIEMFHTQLVKMFTFREKIPPMYVCVQLKHHSRVKAYLHGQ